MRLKFRTIRSLAAIVLVTPASADLIYSNFQNIAIPATYDGVYLNVETGAWNTNLSSPVSGWDINPYFGGSTVWNSPSFQPVRSGTGELDAVLNLAAGTTVSSGSVFSTSIQGPTGENPGGPSYGGSDTHMGNGADQFASGSEGYLGFRLNGTNYGSMRVVFTNNTSGAYIKDWAYDTSGAPVVVGAIQQVGQNIVMSSGFTLASALNNSGGTTNLIKNGSGINILSATSTYTGTTTVNEGTLLINGSTDAASTVSVASGAILGGTGTINGAVSVSGSLSPGAGIETFATGALSFNNDSFLVHQLDSSVLKPVGSDLLKVTGNLALAERVGLSLSDLGGTDVAFDVGDIFSLINYTGTWNGGLFTLGGNELADDEEFTFSLNTWRISYNDAVGGTNYSGEFAGGTDSFVNLHVIPEPRAALLSALSLLLLLRRKV